MQVVCSFVGGAGHLVPQVPLHRALVEAGHTLTLVGRESAARHAPPQLYRRVKALPDRRSRVAGTIAPLQPVDEDAELAVVGEHFAGEAALRSAEAIDDLLTQADLVVCDELDFGAIAAAQKRAVPVVVVSVIASGALVRPDRLVRALDELADALGASQSVQPRGDVFVIPFHPSMRDPRFPSPENAFWMRPGSGSTPRPDGSVLATLGTEFNTESGDLFARLLSALATLESASLVAVGRDLDPARFGPQPAQVRVEQYVDFDAALPRASVVLHHGGSGLLVQSVLAGVPQIVFPMGADQPFTAAMVDRLGLGVVLDAADASPIAIREATKSLQTDLATRDRVRQLRSSMLALPTPTDVTEQIETLLA